MPAQLLVSPAASGRTEYAVDLARDIAASLQAEVRVCVASGLQAAAWRERLAAGGGSLGIHVFTFSGLVESCLAAAGEAYVELHAPVQYRLLRTIIRRTRLNHYESIQAKPGFVQVLQQLIGELKAGLIDPLQLKSAVSELGSEARLSELAQVYDAYQSQLRAQGWADRAGLHWLAVEALRERAPEACRTWPLLIVDGFVDFTPSQLDLLQVLAERVGELLVTLPQAEAVDFPRYRRNRERLEAALGIKAEPLSSSIANQHPALRHLASSIFAPTGGDRVAGEGAVTLREAPDRASEVRTALRWLKERILEHDLPPGEFALLARDITPYRAYVQQIAAEFGISIFDVDGLPLAQSPVIAALLDLLRLFLPLSGGGYALPRAQVIAAWRCPYFQWRRNEETVISASAADSLDLLAREQRVIRGQDQWQEAFAAALTAAEKKPAEDDELGTRTLTVSTVSRLRDQFNFFLQTCEPSAVGSLRDYVLWLENLIGADPESTEQSTQAGSLGVTERTMENMATADADIAALSTLKEILRGLVWAEDMVTDPQPLAFPDFVEELGGAIQAARFELPARAGNRELIVANGAQVRGLSFSAVAILGLGEGSFPAVIAEDPFLRDSDREALSPHLDYPPLPSTQSAEQEYFYEAITRPREHLLLTRPMLAENGAEWVPSPFWDAVLALVDSPIQRIASSSFLSPEETASMTEWWEALAAYGASALPAEWQNSPTWRRIEAAAAIWRTRQEGAASLWEGDLGPLAAQLMAAFGPQTVWSASRLEAYQQCGFLFYCRYVLALQPRPEPAEGLDARQLGALYHDIFERLSAMAPLNTNDAAQVREAVEAEAAPLLDAAPQTLGFRVTPWWPQTRAEIIDNVAASLIELAGDGYQAIYSELPFGTQSPPLIIGTGDDRLQLRGYIDRVDRDADGRLRIIDYKLAGPSTYSAPAFTRGKKLQLPLYALAVEEALGLGQVIDGFYWHFQQARKSGFQLAKAEGGVTGAVETAVQHAQEAARSVRSGSFTPRPPDEGCPDYCPAAGFCWQYSPRPW